MKNQYFGDVSDYRKYGLLRLLTDGGLTLGVNWMLTPNDDGTDGNKREYLSDPAKWRGCDEALYDGLTALLDGGQPPDVSLLEGSDLLPNTTFFSELVPDGKEERLAWASQARDTLSDCDLVFLDPDNGLEIKSKKIGAKNSSKFALWDEVRAYWEQGSSLLIYQHWIHMDRKKFFKQQSTLLKELLGVDRVIGISTPHVLFLLVPQPNHVERIDVVLTGLPRAWDSQMKLVTTAAGHPMTDPEDLAQPIYDRLLEICEANSTWEEQLRDSFTEGEGEYEWVLETLGADPIDEKNAAAVEAMRTSYEALECAVEWLSTEKGW